jgi:aminotransferase
MIPHVSRLQPSLRGSIVEKSDIRVMSVECERVGGLNLSQGVCDTPVPEIVRRAAQDAIDAGVNAYTRHDGVTELRTAIARKLRAYNSIDVDPETEVVVSAGATGAFYAACLALLEPGDEVILFEPYYAYHVSTLEATGAAAVYVRPSGAEGGVTARDLEAAVTAKTRGILVNTPANPSGKVFGGDELSLIAQFADTHDLFVFTDEIYEYFLYDGYRHVSPGSLPGMRERTITISGVSKTFSVTGWRIGYAACAERWARAIGHFNDLIYVCAPAPLQVGVARGIDDLPTLYYEHLAVEYAAKRDMICGALTRANLPPHVPRGAYYVLADVSRLPGKTARERAMYLLNRTGVASVPGSAFFSTGGDDLVRFCYAKPDDVLAEACRRLEAL